MDILVMGLFLKTLKSRKLRSHGNENIEPKEMLILLRETRMLNTVIGYMWGKISILRRENIASCEKGKKFLI